MATKRGTTVCTPWVGEAVKAVSEMTSLSCPWFTHGVLRLILFGIFGIHSQGIIAWNGTNSQRYHDGMCMQTMLYIPVMHAKIDAGLLQV